MRPSPAVLSCLAVALLFLVPPAMAQGHEHDMSEGMLLVMADTPEDGRTVVGDITHFGYVLLDPDGGPFVHHDFHVEVVLNGVTLYATESGHDYDGVGGVDIVFPVPGDYTVTVTVPLEDGRLEETYAGYVVPAEGAVDAEIVLDAPATTRTGTLTPFTYSVVDENGTLLPHTDALVQVRRLADDFLVMEAHTHTHEEAMSFAYAFEKAGTYDVRIVGYTAFPSKSLAVFDPVVTHHVVTVDDDGPIPTAAPSTPYPTTDGSTRVAAAPARQDPAEHAHGGDYVSHVAADPASGTSMKVGPFSQVRASHVTYQTEPMRLVQHIDYEAALEGPDGVVFQSASLHEYEGILTLMSANQKLGAYTWSFSASQGNWTDAQTLTYEVAPANLPLQAGPQFIDVEGLDGLAAATPGDVTFFVHGAGGVPFMHAEVVFELQDADGVPLIAHKLHTHSTGKFAFASSMDEAGEHILRVDPFDIHGSPTPVYYGKDPFSGRALGFDAADGTWPAPDTVTTEESAPDEVGFAPGPSLVAFVALLGAVAVALRRRA